MEARPSASKYVYAVVLILLGVAWVGAIVGVLYFIGDDVQATKAQAAVPAPITSPLPAGATQSYSLTLQTFPMTPDAAWMNEHHYHFDTSPIAPLDEHTDWVRYGPTTNLVLPAHALINMTIQNYDGATPILNGFYAQVQGTINDTMTVDGKKMTNVNPNNISHTFTIHSIPSSNQPFLYVSVPVYAEPDAVENAGADNGLPPQPENIQFSFVTGGPGNYIWQCFDPCGIDFDGFGGPMQTRGYMSGTVVVQG